MSVVFSPDEQLIVSGSWDTTIKLWGVANGDLLKSFDGHTESVYSVAFSRDGQYIASGLRDNTIKVWCVDCL